MCDMKRLTERDEERGYAYSGYDLTDIVNKLAEYEDTEEQGFLLILPCKVGDTFWELNTVNAIPTIYPRIAHGLSHCIYVLERLGKTAFLTKAEAEQALAKMKEV